MVTLIKFWKHTTYWIAVVKILEKLINNLRVKGQMTSITTKILNGEVTNKAMVVKGLKLTSRNGDSNDWLELPDTNTKKCLLVDKEDIATH